MEFLRSFLRRHFAGESVVASRNVGCFLRLIFERFRVTYTVNVRFKLRIFLFIVENEEIRNVQNNSHG